MINWKSRRWKDHTNISTRRHRDSRDRRFTVTEYTPKLNGDVSIYYLAIERDESGGTHAVSERIISRHRTENAAMAACEVEEGK